MFGIDPHPSTAPCEPSERLDSLHLPGHGRGSGPTRHGRPRRGFRRAHASIALYVSISFFSTYMVFLDLIFHMHVCTCKVDLVELQAFYAQFRSLATHPPSESPEELPEGGITLDVFERCLGPLGLEKNLITGACILHLLHFVF
jgi:hypothetical protein